MGFSLPAMTIDEAVREWKSKSRRMGCVSATDWFCARVPGFEPLRLTRYIKDGGPGGLWEHVIATDGTIRIDLAPYADKPKEDK